VRLAVDNPPWYGGLSTSEWTVRVYPRYIQKKFLASVNVAPVVLLNGARQTGKSTLVKTLLEKTHQHYTLDDSSILNAVKQDPVAFLKSHPHPLVIDEIQRAPELWLPIKMAVDQDRQPGKFILTGSAQVLTLPQLSDSLAGRMDIHTLWPLSMTEILDSRYNFVDHVFTDIPFATNIQPTEFPDILHGGYPDILKRPEEDQQEAWCDSYIQTLLYRDLRDVTAIDNVASLMRVLAIVAARSGGLLNIDELSRSTQIASSTLRRYLMALQWLFLVVSIPAWSGNVSRRLIKAPKLFMNDIRLLRYLMGLDHSLTTQGKIIENFVAVELFKQISWANRKTNLYHYRTTTGIEVDFILEQMDGTKVAVEVKSASVFNPRFFDSMKTLEGIHKGIVFYQGPHVLHQGNNLWCLPIQCLFKDS
jgi:predicted AAA+ superfamily ATPase